MNVKGAPQTAQKGISTGTPSQRQHSNKSLKQEPSGLLSCPKEELTTRNKFWMAIRRVISHSCTSMRRQRRRRFRASTCNMYGTIVMTKSVAMTWKINIRVYKDLFRMYYNQVPKVCSFNIDQALGECERLTIISKYYRSLVVLQPYLSNRLTQYRHPLFIAIANDPATMAQTLS